MVKSEISTRRTADTYNIETKERETGRGKGDVRERELNLDKG